MKAPHIAPSNVNDDTVTAIVVTLLPSDDGVALSGSCWVLNEELSVVEGLLFDIPLLGFGLLLLLLGDGPDLCGFDLFGSAVLIGGNVTVVKDGSAVDVLGCSEVRVDARDVVVDIITTVVEVAVLVII